MSTITLDRYVINSLMRDLIGHDHKPAAFAVYLWLAAEQQRINGAVAISYAALSEETGLSRSATQAAVTWLLQRGLLASKHASVTATPVYTTLKPWKRTKT
jgi:hypothetical protein